MSHHPTDFQGDIIAAIKASILEAIPDAEVQASGGGGHFEIEVTSAAFEGKRLVKKHQLVLASIAHLMAGDAAPVHAIDRLVTRTP